MLAFDLESNYSKAFGGNGFPGLVRKFGGISASNLSVVDTFIKGETCLEVHAKAADHWGTIHGNGYNCMGKCGIDCLLGGGFSRNCMKVRLFDMIVNLSL